MSAGVISVSKVKASARLCLAGNWKNAIIVNLLFMVIAGASKFLLPGFIIITGPMVFGLCGYFLGLARNKKPGIESMFDVFKSFKLAVKSLILLFVTSIVILLWTLLFIVPGIIACLKYSQVFFILNDNQNMEPLKAMELSRNMMNGNKGKLFLLHLSFIGWFILCLLSGGIGFIWLCPYMQASLAHFYMELKGTAAVGGKKTVVKNNVKKSKKR